MCVWGGGGGENLYRENKLKCFYVLLLICKSFRWLKNALKVIPLAGKCEERNVAMANCEIIKCIFCWSQT
jgi:hypothetical protein